MVWSSITEVVSGTDFEDTGGTNPWTLTFGAGLQENDVVIVAVTDATYNNTTNMLPGDWTLIKQESYDDTLDHTVQVFRKTMGASPDSSVSITVSALGSCAVYRAFRGVDLVDGPIDGSVGSFGNPNNSNPFTYDVENLTRVGDVKIDIAACGHSGADSLWTTPSWLDQWTAVQNSNTTGWQTSLGMGWVYTDSVPYYPSASWSFQYSGHGQSSNDSMTSVRFALMSEAPPKSGAGRPGWKRRRSGLLVPERGRV